MLVISGFTISVGHLSPHKESKTSHTQTSTKRHTMTQKVTNTNNQMAKYRPTTTQQVTYAWQNSNMLRPTGYTQTTTWTVTYQITQT